MASNIYDEINCTSVGDLMSSTHLELLKNHRSIRKYSEKPIEDTILKDILSTSQFAPTSHNVQAYSVITVKNQETKLELSNICKSQQWVIDCPVFLVFCADFYRLKLATQKHSVNFEVNEVENLLVGSIDTALAAHNLYIQAKLHGIKGVYMGGLRNDIPKVIELLNIPEYVIPLFGMCLGYPSDNPKRKPRLPYRAVIHDEVYNTDKTKDYINEYDSIMKEYYIKRTQGKREDTWSSQMAHYLRKPRHPYVTDIIKKQGIGLY